MKLYFPMLRKPFFVVVAALFLSVAGCRVQESEGPPQESAEPPPSAETPVAVLRMEVRVLNETLELHPGDILRDVILDAREIEGPAVRITESRLDEWVTLDNVRIQCRGNPGLVLEAGANPVNFVRADVTITGASTAVVMTSNEAACNANRIQVVCWGCNEQIVMTGRFVNSNQITGTLHGWQNRQFDESQVTSGVRCEGDANTFDLQFIDWPADGPIAIHLDAPAARNRIVRPAPSLIDDGKRNREEKPFQSNDE